MATAATIPSPTGEATNDKVRMVAAAEAVAALYSAPNKTFKNVMTTEEVMASAMFKEVAGAIITGLPVHLYGGAGTSKSKITQTICEALGYDIVLLNAALMSAENLGIPVPTDDPDTGRKLIDYVLDERLMTDRPKVIFADDEGRASDPQFHNFMMELKEEFSISGIPVPNMATYIAVDNPEGREYGRMASGDVAHNDRNSTVELETRDTIMFSQRALAAIYADWDLTEVFAVWMRLDPKVRDRLSARVLDHVLFALTNRLPAIYGLPIVAGERLRLETSAGEDRTTETLDRVAAALGVTNPSESNADLERALGLVVEHGRNLFVQGTHGIGKTKRVRAAVRNSGLREVYLSGPSSSPEDLSIPMKNDQGGLTNATLERLTGDDPKALVIDEIWRSDRPTMNAFMEPVLERTVGGFPTGVKTVIGIGNPKEAAGHRYDVGRCDPAHASRFDLSIEVVAEGTGSLDWLLSTFGEDAEPFVAWWQEDLDDLGRVLVSPRTLERMIRRHLAGLSLEAARPYVKGEYVAVSLHDLHNRLSARPLARLKAITADLDAWVKALAATPQDPEAHSTVFEAFDRAALTQLEESRETCETLLPLLSQQFKVTLITDKSRQKFWKDALLGKHKKKAAA